MEIEAPRVHVRFLQLYRIQLEKQLESGLFTLPPSELLPNSENIRFPYYIAADAAFPLTSCILRS